MSVQSMTMRWEKVQQRGGSGGPGVRWGHTCNAIAGGKLLYVFGGYGKDQCQTNQVHVYNTANMLWSEPVIKGTPPTPKDSHSCTTVGDDLFVFGGTDGRRPLNDLHKTDTCRWHFGYVGRGTLGCNVCGTRLEWAENRFVHRFTVHPGAMKRILVGICTKKNGAWIKVIAIGECPSSRFSMAGESLEPEMGGVVYIGGCNKNLEALDDMYYLHTGLSIKVDRDERRNEKLYLRKQLKLKCQEQQTVSPAYEKTPFGAEHDPTIYQPMPISSYMPSGRQNFYLNEYHSFWKAELQAKVTKSFPDGYTIETIIDGKPLRGVLFSNKPSSKVMGVNNLNRKTETMNVNMHVDHNSGVESEKSVKHHTNDAKPADVVQIVYNIVFNNTRSSNNNERNV